MRFTHIALVLTAALTLALGAAAQTSTDMAAGAAGLPAPPLPRAGMMSLQLADLEDSAVKGVPFCATITTEHTQTFADGNRVHTTDESTLCRDSQGRTRRESGLNLLGAAPQKSGMKLITITDPVAGFRYVLDTDSKQVRKMPLPPSGPGSPDASGLPPKGEHVVFFQGMGGPGPNAFFVNRTINKGEALPDEAAPTTTSLGDQTINGIHATGTSMSHTIPAGQMGNEQAIVVTSERWYSPELKAVVMTKHSDPWVGELKTQFSSVTTSEPDASLFIVPSDYHVMEDREGPVMIHLPPPPPPQ